MLQLSQSVEKVQQELGFFAYMWYNESGDESDSKTERKP